MLRIFEFEFAGEPPRNSHFSYIVSRWVLIQQVLGLPTLNFSGMLKVAYCCSPSWVSLGALWVQMTFLTGSSVFDLKMCPICAMALFCM